jgi:hypothetical protein
MGNELGKNHMVRFYQHSDVASLTPDVAIVRIMTCNLQAVGEMKVPWVDGRPDTSSAHRYQDIKPAPNQLNHYSHRPIITNTVSLI